LGKSYSVDLNHTYEELQDLVERLAIELISRSNFSLSNSTSSHASISTSWTISAKTMNNGFWQTETAQTCLRKDG